jgi:hypothetical protein
MGVCRIEMEFRVAPIALVDAVIGGLQAVSDGGKNDGLVDLLQDVDDGSAESNFDVYSCSSAASQTNERNALVYRGECFRQHHGTSKQGLIEP